MGDEVDLKKNLNITSSDLKPLKKCGRGREWAMRSTSRETLTKPQETSSLSESVAGVVGCGVIESSS